jgi:hypothetical protein
MHGTFVPKNFNVTHFISLRFTSKQNHLSSYPFRFPSITLKMTLSNEKFIKMPYGASKKKKQATVSTLKTLKLLILSLGNCHSKHDFDLTRDML